MTDKITFIFKVAVMEFERGWGSKIDHVEEFDTVELAEAFTNRFCQINSSLIIGGMTEILYEKDWWCTHV